MNRMIFPSPMAYPIERMVIPGKVKARGRASGFLVFFTIAALIACFLFYVWSRVLVIKLGYDLSEAMEVQLKLVQDNKKLKIEIATLKSLARIERIAQDELDMEKPIPGQIILMK
ncbi:MAG: cell division protein FtsL [Syntrophobacterales bacterium]|nr:MAG: cell division protein FtsL [Syntrophobacterales bacterium]